MAKLFGQPLSSFQTKTELVYERILSVILSGKIPPGGRLNVDELARELGVSKIPVREALQGLEMRGLIVSSPHSGARVAPVSFRQFKGIFLIRVEMEGLAARLAAQTITEERLQELRQVHDEMAAQYQAGHIELMSDYNRRFHTIIARAALYSTLVEMTETLLLNVARFRAVIQPDGPVWADILHEHTKILDALEARDAARAEQLSREHVELRLAGESQREIDWLMARDGSGQDDR